MAVSLNKDTLAYQFGVRPAVQTRSIAHVPVSGVIQQINAFMAEGHIQAGLTKVVNYESVGNAERDALAFYMMNHAATLVRGKRHAFEPLGHYLPVVDEYFNMMAIRAVRMFFYLFMICTREARHTPDPTNGPKWQKWAHDHGGSFKNLITSMHSMNPTSATMHIYNQKPSLNFTLGQHCNGLVDLFMSPTWGPKPTFGGQNWGKIAMVLRDFVEGKITAEMMLDTSFTLAHNGGPIFNKSMMYEHATGKELYTILDVQRSGQIPQLVAHKGVAQASTPEIVRMYDLCHGVLGEDFEGHVDWFKVQELGAVKTYKAEQEAQLAKYGPPITAKHIKEAKEAIAHVFNKKALEDAGLLIPIFDKQTAQKVERVYA